MPSKLWEKLREKEYALERYGPIILKNLKRGHSVPECCKAANISERYVYEFFKNSEYADEDSEYYSEEVVRFCYEFRQANAEGWQWLLDMKLEPKTKTKTFNADGSSEEIESTPSPMAEKLFDRKMKEDEKLMKDIEPDKLTAIVDGPDEEEEEEWVEGNALTESLEPPPIEEDAASKQLEPPPIEEDASLKQLESPLIDDAAASKQLEFPIVNEETKK